MVLPYIDMNSPRVYIQKDGNDNPICEMGKETQMYRTVFWTLWERARVGCFGRMALKYVYHNM